MPKLPSWHNQIAEITAGQTVKYMGWKEREMLLPCSISLWKPQTTYFIEKNVGNCIE